MSAVDGRDIAVAVKSSAVRSYHHSESLAAIDIPLWADYGNITFDGRSLGDSRLLEEDFEEGEFYRELFNSRRAKSEYVGSYFAWDDDERRGRRVGSHHDSTCRRNAWHQKVFPTCNAFHEINMIYDNPIKLGNGYFKVAHGFDFPFTEDRVVLKTMRQKHSEFNEDIMEASRQEVLVMERLSSSPRIVDIYGACATSVTIEFMPVEVEDNIIKGDGYMKEEDLQKCEAESKEPDHICKGNPYSATEKLEMALGMAEAIADLHGFKDGVIVHDDIQPCQFLRNRSGHMKLNDFNRAEVMLFDLKHNEYCKYNNGGVYGNARAPEEDAEEDLDEQIDVYSLGNIYYELLTGLWNFYQFEDDGVVQKKVIRGEVPYIDDRYRKRSYAEAALVHAIERCLVLDPDKRATVFELVEYLTTAVEENKKQTSQLNKHAAKKKAGS